MASMPKLGGYKRLDSALLQCRTDAEEYADTISRVVDTIVEENCVELDMTLEDIRHMMRSGIEIDTQELNRFIILLPTYMYYVGSALEDVGIQGDSAAAIRKEKFDKAYLEVEGKTINDKQSAANQRVISEDLIEQVFVRAYKKVKSRLEQADNTLTSMKKVLQWRITEMEVVGKEGLCGRGPRPRNGGAAHGRE